MTTPPLYSEQDQGLRHPASLAAKANAYPGNSTENIPQSNI